jgi:phage terminase large subunit GpA-like protein
VVSTKGVAGFSRPYLQRSGTKGHQLFLVGSDSVKTMIFARAARNEGIRFSEALAPIYFEQLTSERRVVRYSRGQPVARFERIPGKRAETLDATVYAVAVRQMIGMNEDRRADELESKAAPKRSARAIKSKWLES